jgi:hypothetical protein
VLAAPTNHVEDSKMSLDVNASEKFVEVSWTTQKPDQPVALSRAGVVIANYIGNGSFTDYDINLAMNQTTLSRCPRRQLKNNFWTQDLSAQRAR